MLPELFTLQAVPRLLLMPFQQGAYSQYLHAFQNPGAQGPYYDPIGNHLYTSFPGQLAVEASIPLNVTWGTTGYGGGQFHLDQGQPYQGPSNQGQTSYTQPNYGQ